jgi:hypothetical protein
MVFKDRQLLDTMIEMRRQGWTYETLGLIFKVDHSSIYKACKIRHIRRPQTPLSIDLTSILRDVGIKPPKDKTYQDYLVEDKYRKYPNLKRLMTSV